LDTLLRAWPEVARRLPDAELVLLGRRGPGYDEVDAEGLAARLDIGTSVRLVERTDNAAVATWLGASDVMVLPSIAEGFGVALVEGLACGLRAVATRSGGGEDIVTSADGRLVPVGDTRALAEALATELTTRASRDREAIAARARSRFAYPEVARRISDVYGAVLGWASGSPATSTAVGTG
jgi:glycosyltransferase involved in cell wall biosynthesis